MTDSKNKKGVILAGGKGTRFLPITLEIPKPLIPVNKKPLINYSIETFARHGIGDIAVIIPPSHRNDYTRWLRVYEDEFSDMGIRISLWEEEYPMGTFGFIARHLRDWIGNEDIFVTNSDDIKNVN